MFLDYVHASHNNAAGQSGLQICSSQLIVSRPGWLAISDHSPLISQRKTWSRSEWNIFIYVNMLRLYDLSNHHLFLIDGWQLAPCTFSFLYFQLFCSLAPELSSLLWLFFLKSFVAENRCTCAPLCSSNKIIHGNNNNAMYSKNVQ